MTDNPGPLPPLPATIGRMVHYVSRGSADGVYPPTCRAAIITATELGGHDPGDAQQMLKVLTPNGDFNDAVSEHRGSIRPGAPASWVRCVNTPRCGAPVRARNLAPPGTRLNSAKPPFPSGKGGLLVVSDDHHRACRVPFRCRV